MEIEKLNFKNFLEVAATRSKLSDWEVSTLYFSRPDMPVVEIAKKAGTSVAEIYRIIQKSGSSPNRQIINHANVLMFFNSGLRSRNIAELTGYTPRNVRYIVHKKAGTWR